MHRRDFLKNGVFAAGVTGSLTTIEPLVARGTSPATPPAEPPLAGDHRSADYLRRVQGEPLLPKPPVVREAAGAVRITPMPLAERVRRKIVPQRGFCSLAPGNGASPLRQWRHEH